MKRPEGFDKSAAADQSAAPQRRVAPVRRAAPVRTPPEPQKKAGAERPRREDTQAAATARPRRSSRGAARPRSARAEFAAAERARKREERSEVRRFTRSSRRRRIGWITAGSLFLVMLLLVVAAVFSPLLALKTITVDGTQRLDAVAVQDALDAQLGTPLALLDEGRIRDDLSDFTLIRSYVTEIVPPDTLLVHIVERSTIGVVQVGGGYDLVDPAGVVIDTVPERPAGVPLLELARGDGIKSAGFAAMAQVLLALPATVLAQVDTITAQTRDDVTLTLVGGQRVVWGSAQSSACKAENLAALLTIHGGAGAGEYDVAACGVPIWHAD